MHKKFSHDKSISLKFVVTVFAVLLVTACYIAYPGGLKKKNNKISYEEMLEYNTQLKKEETYIPIYLMEQQEEAIPDFKKSMPYIQQNRIVEAQRPSVIGSPVDNLLLYNKLLDELAQYPPNSEASIRNITERLLLFKGYPSSTLKIIFSNSEVPSSQSMYQYILATFNFATGEMYVSNDLYQMDIRAVIAVLAHELDHFDKIAKICKSNGIEQFRQIYSENGIDSLNLDFWERVSMYADTEKFETGLYTNALKRFLARNDLELVSSYADFYRYSENMRNPLEKSAYKESDYVYAHFGIPVIEGNMKQIAKSFEKVDKAIYNLVSQLQMPTHERIALFDYLFAKAIIELMPEYKSEFVNCVTNKNGDLTTFWLEFENNYQDFYKNAKVTTKTLNDITNLFNNMIEQISRGISVNETAEAINYKINTLKSNIVYKGAIENLKKTTINYLSYLKTKGINAPEEELNAILILLCIENQLYTNSLTQDISLKDLIIPNELVKIYDIQKYNRLMFIYNNEAFKAKNVDYAQDENAKLTILLNNARLNKKIK